MTIHQPVKQPGRQLTLNMHVVASQLVNPSQEKTTHLGAHMLQEVTQPHPSPVGGANGAGTPVEANGLLDHVLLLAPAAGCSTQMVVDFATCLCMRPQAAAGQPIQPVW